MKQLDTDLQNLIADLKVYIASLEAKYAELQKRIQARVAEANNGLEPTVDCYGRFHAPCDGYCWDDVTYGGGQYLHFTEEMMEQIDYMREQLGLPPVCRTTESIVSKIRLKATPQIAEELAEVLGSTADVGCGKVWESGECYIYITSKRQAVLNFIKDYKEEQMRIRNEQIEAERAAREAAKGPAPEGKQTVRGRIAKINVVEGYAWNTYDTKMFVVLENGSTVYGTCPAAISATVGVVVEFTATFEHAKDTTTHAFFKRPTKAREIAVEETEGA